YDVAQQTSLIIPISNSNTKDSNGNNPLNPFNIYGNYQNNFIYNFCENYDGVTYYDETNYHVLNSEIYATHPSIFYGLSSSDSISLVNYNFTTTYNNIILGTPHSETYFDDIFEAVYAMGAISEIERDILSIYLNELTSLAYEYNITLA